MKNLRYIAPLLCILLSSWASAQTQSAQPETDDSETRQQSEPGNSQSEEEERKRYEDLSKKSLSRLTSELRAIENQLQEKEDAFSKLSRSQEHLEDRIPEWRKNLKTQLLTVESAWTKFEGMMGTVEHQEPSKTDLENAQKAAREFQTNYFDFQREFHKFSQEKEVQALREYGVPVNIDFPQDWRSISSIASSIVSSTRELNKQDTDKATHDKLKGILSDFKVHSQKDIPGLFQSGLLQVEKEANALQESLNKEVLKRSSELTVLRSKKETLDQVVDDKSGADNKLTYAIYFMVAALIILYVATLFARESIQSTIFENRTLVEMIGMAFLLLTIIILGTGEKMDRSVLGALLGTVGGYIFGQQNRSSDRPKRRKQANPDGPPRKKKKKATELMTENVQRAAQEGTTTPPATKAPEMPSGMVSSTPVTRAEITPPEALKILPEQKPAAGS